MDNSFNCLCKLAEPGADSIWGRNGSSYIVSVKKFAIIDIAPAAYKGIQKPFLLRSSIFVKSANLNCPEPSIVPLDKLITSLKSATTKDDVFSLDKSKSAFNDLFGSFRMCLLCLHLEGE
jgi:hypothetical protein